MAFDGTLLNRPSAPPSARSRRAHVPLHRRLRAAARARRLAERRRRRRRRRRCAYKLVRPSTVTVTLTRPTASDRRRRATPSALPGRTPSPTSPRPRSCDGPTARRPASAEGRWTLTVEATDELGQSSTMSRAFVRQHDARVPRRSEAAASCRPAGGTLGICVAAGARGTRRRHGRDARPARSCAPSRAAATSRAGQRVVWNGLDRDGRRVRAASTWCASSRRNELGVGRARAAPSRVQQIAAAPKPRG